MSVRYAATGAAGRRKRPADPHPFGPASDASEGHLSLTSLYFTPVPAVSTAKPVALLENMTGCD